MDDLISRQTAIDAVNRADVIDMLEMYPFTEYGEYETAREVVKRLPSAQPEIVRCKECKYRGEKPISDGRYWCDIHNVFMYYCSDAERRTNE